MSAESSKENKVPRIGVGVVILNERREVLLGKRREGRFAVGTWALPGGKVEKNETVKEGGARELWEETGLSIVGKIEIVSVGFEAFYAKEYLTLGIKVRVEGEAFEAAPEEVGDWEWFPLDKLPEPLFLPSKRILKNLSLGIVYSKDPLINEEERRMD